jgi:signal transduction histidine kinase
MNKYIRIAFSLTTLALIFFYGRSSGQSLLLRGDLFLLALGYLFIIWIPDGWWTYGKHILCTCLVISAVVVLHELVPATAPSESLLLIPLVLLLGREREHQRHLVFLAAIAMAVMCILAPQTAFLVTVMPVTVALYLSVRALNIYKASYRLSLKNIEELNAAHQELQKTHLALQEANVDSMRYAALAERTRLAQELHDGLGHRITSLIVQLQALELMIPVEPEQAARMVPDLLGIARSAMAEIHEAVKTWRQEEGSDGLVALQGLVSQCAAHAPFALTFALEANGSSWTVELSAALYRLLQEALTNILRHASASTVQVLLQEKADQILLTVSDDGCYQEGQPLIPGYGIRGMLERCHVLGGTCKLSANQPHGLHMEVMLPLLHSSRSGEEWP